MGVVERWQMNRAGILNFWFYDDEEFQLEEGRVILRGANGSGKSVTMQSFIPLVLDGDKRPERLDPFGSRDRRLEYYLLGEDDHGHTDRTGYLWLEFYHSEKKLFKTIGIGIRARRGAAQLGFWGFLLDDGRRINHDFWLYDCNLWKEQNKKIPLNRKNLEDLIGAGQVVQEQAAYKSLVNKAIFGFRDEESYKDLLKLLLELRSPKLSKDFKPSSMYEILTRALPPLSEEELNPLSDVMEDMDQITDRLEELQIHIGDLQKITEKYNKYNEYLLKQSSEEVWVRSQKNNQLLQQISSHEIEKNEVNKKYLYAMETLRISRERLEEIDSSLDVLNRSEVMEKHREMERLEQQIQSTINQLTINERRLNETIIRRDRLNQQVTYSNDKLVELSNDQHKAIEEMENIARIVEFKEHDIYQGIWSRSVHEDEKWADSWTKDFQLHQYQLSVTYEIARSEREASITAKEAEIELGEIVRERNITEEELAKQENEFEETRDKLREAFVSWQQKLTILPVGGDQLRESLRSLSLISVKERSYNTVRLPMIDAYEQKQQEILQQLSSLNHQKQSLQKDCESLQAERDEWMNSKDPEPERSVRKTESRSRRRLGTGAPLYTVCEFNPELSEGDRALIEETLAHSGLLDAWIFPDGRVIISNANNEEEVWFEPAFQTDGESLGSVLYATPSLECGLSHEDINQVLNSIRWLKDTKGLNDKSLLHDAFISEKGHFKLGPLTGKNASKIRAEFIGSETRKQTRLIKISNLEENIQQLHNMIIERDHVITEFENQRKQLQQELDDFPSDIELQKHIDALIQVSYRLKEIMNQEQKVENRYKQKVANWREFQIKLTEQTAGWSRIKQEHQIKEAIESCHDYRTMISELFSLWRSHKELKQRYSHLLEEQSSVLIQIEEEQLSKEQLLEDKKTLTAQINEMKKLMSGLGPEEIFKEIKLLKEEKKALKGYIDCQQDTKEKLRQEIGRINANFDLLNNQRNESEDNLKTSLEKWSNEMKLGLVLKWKEYQNSSGDSELSINLCEQIINYYRSEFIDVPQERVANELSQEFSVARSNLQDYALNLEYLESGRMIISSNRDRFNSLPPSVLLEELRTLEEEQRVLLTESDRALYEEIILGSVGKAVRNRINRAQDWIDQMKKLMGQRDTSSGLKLSLDWKAKGSSIESELDTSELIELLKLDAHRMDDEQIEQVIEHFRTRITQAKQEAQDGHGALREYLYHLLDYRLWFEFELSYKKGGQTGYKPLTDSKFNVLSGGEKAMSMYIPLFAATYSRYSDADMDAPRIISLDEAFAGVDESNMRDMFHLLTDMGFDYIMTSQVLWGCYDTVPRLAIYEIFRPKDIDVVTLFHYRWNGQVRVLVEKELESLETR
ncbi:TIGR02680 family protein [Paenibacillus uliginis N3/975]|uniref:TIGR02680 family protein n=1 Tax=Paenibacillus uliginis N3/975 TaxID=1313296 RepID=A0A1X7HPX0_9BACL|nr:TIGR02680 family protein [Paenibacillus uliginis N3/975]